MWILRNANIATADEVLLIWEAKTIFKNIVLNHEIFSMKKNAFNWNQNYIIFVLPRQVVTVAQCTHLQRKGSRGENSLPSET